jgi:hypothetical protein
MIVILAVLALAAGGAHEGDGGALPVCGNRVIVETVKRARCTVGDVRCWNRSGGFCMDWVERRLGAGRRLALDQFLSVVAGDVRVGDVAVFAARAHYAHVDRVIRGEGGRAVAVDLSEYNFGTCWVDEDAMVTDQYKVQNRRLGVPLGDVDGGFMRLSRGGR